jgi:hypothetical protein
MRRQQQQWWRLSAQAVVHSDRYGCDRDSWRNCTNGRRLARDVGYHQRLMPFRSGRQVPRVLILACEALLALFVLRGTGCATQSPTNGTPTPTTTPGAIDSGIYGHLARGFGNAPANPPSTECVKVYDATGTNLIARATCTGMMRDFRVQLAAGRYVVEFGGRWQPKSGRVVFVPERRTIDVGRGQWIKLTPPPLPGPVP